MAQRRRSNIALATIAFLAGHFAYEFTLADGRTLRLLGFGTGPIGTSSELCL